MDTAKIFQNGQSQAVRLPKEYRFTGKQVFIKKLGNVVCLISANETWDTLFCSLEMFSDDFLDHRSQPPAQMRETL